VRNWSRSSRWLGAISFILSIPIFIRMTEASVSSDIMSHVYLARLEVASGRWYSYTLWYPIIYLFSGGGSVLTFRVISVLLLALAVMFKVRLIEFILRSCGLVGLKIRTYIAVFLSLATPVLAPAIPVLHGSKSWVAGVGSIYLGQFSGLVWHNSTAIACAPLVLVCGIAAKKYLQTCSGTDAAWLSVATVVCALMKPNFTLAFVPALALVGIWHQRSRPLLSRLGQVALIAVPTIGVWFVQIWLIQSDKNIGQTSFTIQPFVVWSYYSSHWWISILQSFAFPAAAGFAIHRSGKKTSPWLSLTRVTAVVSVIEFSILGEKFRSTGQNIYDGNWFWGVHAATLLLFVVSAADLLSLSTGTVSSGTDARARNWFGSMAWSSKLAWIVLGLHFLTGLLYITRLFGDPRGFLS
jgi:hypothetical protein